MHPAGQRNKSNPYLHQPYLQRLVLHYGKVRMILSNKMPKDVSYVVPGRQKITIIITTTIGMIMINGWDSFNPLSTSETTTATTQRWYGREGGSMIPMDKNHIQNQQQSQQQRTGRRNDDIRGKGRGGGVNGHPEGVVLVLKVMHHDVISTMIITETMGAEVIIIIATMHWVVRIVISNWVIQRNK
jgi:hypothetical protein